MKLKLTLAWPYICPTLVIILQPPYLPLPYFVTYQCESSFSYMCQFYISNSPVFWYVSVRGFKINIKPIVIQHKNKNKWWSSVENIAPLYLTLFLSQKIVPRQLRCNYQHLLQVPLTSLKYADRRSFQKAAPILYNALPVTIIKQLLLWQSINRLKTYLFTKAYKV